MSIAMYVPVLPSPALYGGVWLVTIGPHRKNIAGKSAMTTRGDGLVR